MREPSIRRIGRPAQDYVFVCWWQMEKSNLRLFRVVIRTFFSSICNSFFALLSSQSLTHLLWPTDNVYRGHTKPFLWTNRAQWQQRCDQVCRLWVTECVIDGELSSFTILSSSFCTSSLSSFRSATIGVFPWTAFANGVRAYHAFQRWATKHIQWGCKGGSYCCQHWSIRHWASTAVCSWSSFLHGCSRRNSKDICNLCNTAIHEI